MHNQKTCKPATYCLNTPFHTSDALKSDKIGKSNENTITHPYTHACTTKILVNRQLSVLIRRDYMFSMYWIVCISFNCRYQYFTNSNLFYLHGVHVIASLNGRFCQAWFLLKINNCSYFVRYIQLLFGFCGFHSHYWLPKCWCAVEH